MNNREHYNNFIDYLAERIYADYDTIMKLEAYQHIEDYINKSDALLRIPLPGELSNIDLATQVRRLENDRDKLYKELFNHIKNKAMSKITDDIAYRIINDRRD